MENDRNSTQDQKNLSKYIFMLQLKMALVNFEGSEMWNAPDQKNHVENVMELQTSYLGLPHKLGRGNLNFEKFSAKILAN